MADSSFLITLFDADDARHADALEAAEDPDPIVVPPEVISETLGVVHARLGFDVARDIWEWIQRMPHMEVLERTDVAPVAALFLEHGGRLSWVDAAVAARCRALDAEPLAFDDAIHAAART